MAMARELGNARVKVFGFGRCSQCAKYNLCENPIPPCDHPNTDECPSADEARTAEANGSDDIHPFGAEAEARTSWAEQVHALLILFHFTTVLIPKRPYFH